MNSAAPDSLSWRNWAGTATATHARRVRPRDTEEISAAIMAAADEGRTVRALGSGHSFTDAAATDGVALDLSEMTGIVAAEGKTGLVTVRAGTTLHELNQELDGRGLAMTNLGDIDAQTIAGAISTGTHGTGAKFGGIATQVVALELVLADGSVVRCSADDRPELFAAAKVGLGALGVVSTVTLQCVPAFVVAADEHPEPVDKVLEQLDELISDNDHFEFYWFPYGNNALVKRNNRQPPGTQPRPLSPRRQYLEYELLENKAFGLLCRTGRTIRPLVKPLNKLSSAMLSSRSYSDVSHRVFVTSRQVRFVESEFAVPRETLPDVFRELRLEISKLRHPVMFPVEFRVAAADDIWLSTAHERATAYVAIHQFVGMPYREYFERFWAIVGAVDGRPHWGKLHPLTADALVERYPRFIDFLRVRDTVDPHRRFGNAYLRRVLGE
ncbi:MAG: FAD-binding protein [Sciscionella sp.]|nr:FAD-binding protein [Sciscionella sp.]